MGETCCNCCSKNVKEASYMKMINATARDGPRANGSASQLDGNDASYLTTMKVVATPHKMDHVLVVPSPWGTVYPEAEVWSGLTMLGPAAVTLSHLIILIEETGSVTARELVMALSVFTHMPASMAFHFYQARTGTVTMMLLYMDLTFLHALLTAYVWCLGGSAPLVAAAATANGIFACRLWLDTTSDFERLAAVVAANAAFAVPLLQRGLLAEAAALGVLLACAAGLTAVSGSLRGWGHVASHVLLVPIQAVLMTAIA